MVKARTILGFACVIATAVYAQEVTIGIVGIMRVSEPAGFYIAGMPYNMSQTNTPDIIYADELPLGSKIYKWNGNIYEISEYNEFFDFELFEDVIKWSADYSLNTGEGYWVYTPSLVDTFLSGDVGVVEAVTNTINIGFQICAYPYPVDRVVTNLGFNPSLGDKIYVWNGTGYESSEYNEFFDFELFEDVIKWSDETLLLETGQGFWYSATAETDWIVQRPYSLD